MRHRLMVLGLLISLAGCSPIDHSPTASVAASSQVAGLSWATASVDQPAALTEEASNRPSFCSPCHSAVQTSLAAVASRPGALLAAGWFTPFRAAAWTSSDAGSWRLEPAFPSGDGALLDAAVASGESGWIVGGSDVRGPAVWDSLDGRTWRETQLPVGHGPDTGGVRGVVRALARAADAWIAGGEVGPPADPRPAIWVSSDAASWNLVELATPAGQRTGPGGSVAAVAVEGTEVVAVGRSIAPTTSTAAAWRSDDAGQHWVGGRVLPDAGVGVMSGVSGLRVAAGWIAVGAANDDAAAAPAWRSLDGLEWRLEPPEDSRTNFGTRIRMTAVATGAAGLVAVGWMSDAANGSAAAWESADGGSWRRAEAIPEFSGGGAAAVTSVGERYVAVGSLGWPDDRIATVWVSPSAR